MVEEEPRENIEEIINNEEPIKEEIKEDEIKEEIPKPKAKSKAKAKPKIKITKEPVEPVEAIQTIEEKPIVDEKPKNRN